MITGTMEFIGMEVHLLRRELWRVKLFMSVSTHYMTCQIVAVTFVVTTVRLSLRQLSTISTNSCVTLAMTLVYYTSEPPSFCTLPPETCSHCKPPPDLHLPASASHPASSSKILQTIIRSVPSLGLCLFGPTIHPPDHHKSSCTHARTHKI